MDARRIEHEIRTLPGVVACQLTSTTALVLVGPDGDSAAIQAAVAKVLDAAASALSLNVVSAPKPAPVLNLARRRRRKAAFAAAGSAAALSASVAAAATFVVLGGTDLEVPDAQGSRTETAAPITLLTEPPLVEQLAPTVAARPAATPGGAVVEPAPAPEPPAGAPVLLAVPLPAALTGLEATRARPAVKLVDRPSDAQPQPAPEPEPELVAASAGASEVDGPPYGVARRQRNGGHGPAEQAADAATAEGARTR